MTKLTITFEDPEIPVAHTQVDLAWVRCGDLKVELKLSNNGRFYTLAYSRGVVNNLHIPAHSIHAVEGMTSEALFEEAEDYAIHSLTDIARLEARKAAAAEAASDISL